MLPSIMGGPGGKQASHQLRPTTSGAVPVSSLIAKGRTGHAAGAGPIACRRDIRIFSWWSDKGKLLSKVSAAARRTSRRVVGINQSLKSVAAFIAGITVERHGASKSGRSSAIGMHHKINGGKTGLRSVLIRPIKPDYSQEQTYRMGRGGGTSSKIGNSLALSNTPSGETLRRPPSGSCCRNPGALCQYLVRRPLIHCAPWATGSQYLSKKADKSGRNLIVRKVTEAGRVA